MYTFKLVQLKSWYALLIKLLKSTTVWFYKPFESQLQGSSPIWDDVGLELSIRWARQINSISLSLFSLQNLPAISRPETEIQRRKQVTFHSLIKNYQIKLVISVSSLSQIKVFQNPYREVRKRYSCITNHQNQWWIQDFPDRGRQPIIWQFVAKNCMKMKEIGPRGSAMESLPPPPQSTNENLSLQGSLTPWTPSGFIQKEIHNFQFFL